MTITQRMICLSLLVWTATLTGCMHTRYAESSSLLSAQSGGCPCCSHNSTYRERRWSGFWLRQPAEVQP